MPRGLRHVALSISLLSPIARRPEALLAMNIASLIFRPDLGFLALTSFQSFNRPNRPLLLLTNKIRPRLAATSFDDFAIAIPHRPNIESFARFNKMILEAINGRCLTGGCLLSASLFAGLFLSLQHIRLTAVGLRHIQEAFGNFGVCGGP